MTFQTKTILPFAFSPSASTPSSDCASTTSASIPPAGVPTLPPSAHSDRRNGAGETISPLSSPRSQCGTVTGFGMDVRKALRLERGLGPRDRTRVARRAGEPRADGVREAADRFVRAVRLARRAHEALERDPEIGGFARELAAERASAAAPRSAAAGTRRAALHESLSSSLFSSTWGPGSASSLR